MLEIVFLGTAASIPSRDRAMSALAVKQGKSVTLFDCAEGTQRQLMTSTLSFMKINNIFITHLHGDHVLGLPGLLQTMGMSNRSEKLRLFGPIGTKDCVQSLMNACEGETTYEYTIQELNHGDVVELDDAVVKAFSTCHGIDSLGYRYEENGKPGKFDREKAIKLGIAPGPEYRRLCQGETVNGIEPNEIIGPERKGVSVVYTGDTAPCDHIEKYSQDVDVLIHESTYAEEEAELAIKFMHSTCIDAAKTAKANNVKCLILTHISNRYDDVTTLETQARKVFENTFVASDYDRFIADDKGVRPV